MWFVLVLIVLACVIPAFRVVLVIAAIGFGILLLWAVMKDRDDRAAEAVARTLVSPDQIELVDVSYANDKIKGRLRNNSQYELRRVDLKLTMQDCTSSGCETVDEAKTDLSQSVPPGQARDFDKSATFYHLGRPHGTFKWSYTVVGIEAEPYVRGRSYEASWR